jgi:DHA2 family multidrug resistance protein
VQLFKSFNFATSSLMMFVLGILLFASLVMMPQFLQTLMGYSATAAGLVLSAASIVLLIEMPIVGQLTTIIPVKYMFGFGWLALAFSMYYSTRRLDLEISFRSAMWLRVVQVFGMGFLFVPITLSAYIGVPPEKGNSVAGIVNCNIGSSVGTSMVTTLLARRTQFHQSILAYHATNFDPAFQSQVAGLSQQLIQSGISAADAREHAYGLIYQALGAQAQTLAYLDTFMVLAVAAGIMFLLSFLVRKNDPRLGGAAVAE